MPHRKRHDLNRGHEYLSKEHCRIQTCSSDNCNMGRVVELFVHDGTVVLPSWSLEELQFDQVLCIQGLACAWVHLVPLDEGHNVNKVKNIALVVTIGVLKRLEAESAVVKGQPFVVNLHAMKTSNIFLDKKTH